MPPNRCFCSEHIVLAGRQHFITLWHYTHPNTFSNRYPLFRGGNNIIGSFCHHYRCRFWCRIGESSSSLLSSSPLSVNAVNETPMKRSTAEELHLISFTLKMFFLHFLIRNCIDEFTLKTVGHQNIASNPSYRGISQTGSFAICSDFFFLYPKYIFLSWSQSFFSSRHTTLFPWYIFSFMLYLINAEMLCIFHCLDLFLYICRDFYLNIWWKGPT